MKVTPAGCSEGLPPLQDGKRELEYRAGQQDPGQADGKPNKEQQQEEEAQDAAKDGKQPEAEAPQPDSAEQPGAEEEEGPVNEQAGDAGQQQQQFTTPEVSLPGSKPLPRLALYHRGASILSGAAHQTFPQAYASRWNIFEVPCWSGAQAYERELAMPEAMDPPQNQ